MSIDPLPIERDPAALARKCAWISELLFKAAKEVQENKQADGQGPPTQPSHTEGSLADESLGGARPSYLNAPMPLRPAASPSSLRHPAPAKVPKNEEEMEILASASTELPRASDFSDIGSESTEHLPRAVAPPSTVTTLDSMLGSDAKRRCDATLPPNVLVDTAEEEASFDFEPETKSGAAIWGCSWSYAKLREKLESMES